MGNLIGKGANLILQIIVVVAAVLVFSWFDPFDILAPTKRTLKNTPIQIQSMREIGQLITAEYYGEVISSLKEVIGEQQYNEMQEFNYIVDDLHEEFKFAIADFIEEDLPNKNKDQIFSAFIAFSPELVNDSMYKTYLYYIFEKIKDRNYKRNEINKELGLDQQKTLIKRLYLNRYSWRDQLFEIETDEFKSVKKEVIEKASKKDYRNSRLVLIGRGWVKAGFDFGELSDRNFRYDETRRRIHLIGLQPQIISATINPWFIPEEGVEGFEFLIAERGARLKPHYTKMVKQRCLDKLQQQAMDKQILKRSQDNAETHLKAFFSLLLDDEIEGVHFHTNFLDYTLDVILSDSVIRNEEVYTIDSSICYFNENYKGKHKYKKLSQFIDTLQKAKTDFYGVSCALNNNSSLLFSIILDRVIDSADIRIADQRGSLILLDTLWSSKLFDDQYFTKGRDSLTVEEKIKRHFSFDSSIHKNNEQFCENLKLLLVKQIIEPDSLDIRNESIRINLQQDSCKVILK